MATNSVFFGFQVIVRITVVSVIVVATVFSVVTDVVTFGWPVRAVAVDSISLCLRGIVRISAVIVVVLVLEDIDDAPLSCFCPGLACVALPVAMVLTPSGENSSRLLQRCPVGDLTSHPPAVGLASVCNAHSTYPLGGFHTCFGRSPLSHPKLFSRGRPGCLRDTSGDPSLRNTSSSTVDSIGSRCSDYK